MADDISMFECWRNIYDVRYEGEHVVSIDIFCRYIVNQVNGVISCFRLHVHHWRDFFLKCNFIAVLWLLSICTENAMRCFSYEFADDKLKWHQVILGAVCTLFVHYTKTHRPTVVQDKFSKKRTNTQGACYWTYHCIHGVQCVNNGLYNQTFV